MGPCKSENSFHACAINFFGNPKWGEDFTNWILLPLLMSLCQENANSFWTHLQRFQKRWKRTSSKMSLFKFSYCVKMSITFVQIRAKVLSPLPVWLFQLIENESQDCQFRSRDPSINLNTSLPSLQVASVSQWMRNVITKIPSFNLGFSPSLNRCQFSQRIKTHTSTQEEKTRGDFATRNVIAQGCQEIFPHFKEGQLIAMESLFEKPPPLAWGDHDFWSMDETSLFIKFQALPINFGTAF